MYHLQAGRSIWSPSSKYIDTSRKFCSEFLFEKTGLRINQPSSDGRTTSTGNVVRQCFLNKNNFIFHASTLVPAEIRVELGIIQNNLSAILRIYNSSHEIDTEKLETLAKET